MKEQQPEKQFAKGFYYDNPAENAPSFLIGKISVKVSDAVAFLQQHENNAGYVNLDILMPKEGSRPYLALNTWKAEKPESLKEENVPPEAAGEGVYEPGEGDIPW